MDDNLLGAIIVNKVMSEMPADKPMTDGQREFGRVVIQIAGFLIAISVVMACVTMAAAVLGLGGG